LFEPIHPVIYFAIWAAMAIGGGSMLLQREPEFRIRWHARMVLLANLGIGIGMLLVFPYPFGWFMILLGGGLITYLNISKTTICTQCGRIIQPVNLISKAQFCSRGGGKTAVSKLVRA
jgi:hypothetical protein